MNDNIEDSGQFSMRMDKDEDDNVIPTQVDELRIEKLSTRVTVISIMIPVLIVVVLAFAYLDMKKRVTRTEDTGTSVVENLSKDLESRFSTLSMRQANLEELIKKLGAENDKSLARIQVKLKKLEDSTKGIKRTMVSPAVLESKTAKLQQEIGNVAQSVDAGNAQMAEMTQGIKGQIDQIGANAAQNQNRMAQIDEKLISMDASMIDKASLNLALKLEILKLKKGYKAQLDDIQDRIRQLELKAPQSAPQNAPAPAQPSQQSAPAPKPASGLTTPQTNAPTTSGGIVEQKIGQ